jgi:hypothetical protein
MKTLRIKSVISLLFVLTLSISQTFAGDEKPEWLKNRPVRSKFYIGIGMAQKNNSAQDYHQVAKENALQDLSSEINVNISSNITVKLTENADRIQEELRSQIQTSTKASLEGYEMVDSWENDQEYWVYYELSKSKFRMRHLQRLQNASDLGKNFYTQAQEKLKSGDAAAAITLNIQGLNSIAEFIAEPIEAEIEGETIYLQNALYSDLQSILNRIEIKPEMAKVKGTTGRSLRNPLVADIIFDSGTPVKNLPVHFKFTKGTGELVGDVKSDGDGKAASIVSAIQSPEKLQIVAAEINLNASISNSESQITKSVLSSLNVPSTRFIIEVSGLSFYVESEESHLGQPLDMKYIEPKLKNFLADKGYDFSDDISAADVYIKIKAASRQGAEVYNLYSAFVDLTVSATNLTTGEEVYKNSMNGIKGIQLDYNKASIEALKNAGKKIEELVPDLIAKVTQ